MNGLVYATESETESTPVYWLGIVLAAIGITLLPLFFLTLPATPEIEEVVSITVSFDGPIPDLDAIISLPKAENQPDATLPLAVEPPAAVKLEAPKPPEPAATVVVLPPEKRKDKPAPDASVRSRLVNDAPPAAKAKVEPKPLHDRDLQPMAPVDVAFDQNSKVTKAPPKDGNLSDRNSNAADRGPKNLPIGDPYMDKGETNLIKYDGKRGEGNLPPLSSDASSGSVKKEGSPIAGDGSAPIAPDFSKAVKTAEKPRPKTIETEGSELDVAEKKKVAAIRASTESVKPNIEPVPKAVPPSTDSEIADIGLELPPPRAKQFPSEPLRVATSLEFDQNKKTKNADAVEPLKIDTPETKEQLAEKRVAISKALDEQAELAAFEAQLNGANVQAAGDGSVGKTGPKLRKGELGHEGNGTIRPGDDNAVSDVTTINLSSSATEVGDPRFEKRFDPKTAYIRAFARRIDGKWKADIQAKLRVRLVPGMVSIRVILRKDGKLMEASEAFRNRGVTDEYVATAKHAVEEAADPSAEPFPAALAGRETIEYTFNFLYQ